MHVSSSAMGIFFLIRFGAKYLELLSCHMVTSHILVANIHRQLQACFKDREDPGQQVKFAPLVENMDYLVHLSPPLRPGRLK